MFILDCQELCKNFGFAIVTRLHLRLFETRFKMIVRHGCFWIFKESKLEIFFSTFNIAVIFPENTEKVRETHFSRGTMHTVIAVVCPRNNTKIHFQLLQPFCECWMLDERFHTPHFSSNANFQLPLFICSNRKCEFVPGAAKHSASPEFDFYTKSNTRT